MLKMVSRSMLSLACCVLIAASRADEPGKTAKPDAKGDASTNAALAKYNEMRAKAGNSADAQWKLAVWCEQNKLKGEALTHYAVVVQLDPRRDAALRKLGFKKQKDGRWLTEDQIKPHKVWAAKLNKLHTQIHGGKKQAEAGAALEALAAIDDPKAVPAIFEEFAGGKPADQMIAVQLFGQIQSLPSTRALATLAVYGTSPDIRGRATQTLRQRDPAEYLPALARLLVEPLTFEVRPVGGPDSPGVLFVEGERFSLRRLYAPPPPPNLSIQPGDIVSYDEYGLPVITRLTGLLVAATAEDKKTGAFFELQQAAQLSVSRNIVQSRNAAVAAQAQLQNDVQTIKVFNKARKAFDDLVLNVMKDASGKDVGDTPKACRAWLAEQDGYVQEPKNPGKAGPRNQTVTEFVPLDYTPSFSQFTFLFVPGVKDRG